MELTGSERGCCLVIVLTEKSLPDTPGGLFFCRSLLVPPYLVAVASVFRTLFLPAVVKVGNQYVGMFGHPGVKAVPRRDVQGEPAPGAADVAIADPSRPRKVRAFGAGVACPVRRALVAAV